MRKVDSDRIHSFHMQQMEEDIGLSVGAARSRARIVRCGGRYDPQLVERSSE